MSVHSRGALYAALCVLAASCGDTTVEPARPAIPGPRFTVEEIGDQQAPAGVPPEYQVPTWIRVRADAGWAAEGIAYGQAIVEFTGNRATARATVTTNEGSASNAESGTWLFPWSRSITANVLLWVGQCEGMISVQANGEASTGFTWITPNGSGTTSEWGKKTGSAWDFAECRVPVQQTGTSGGGGGGATMTCYTLTIDYYWYYPDSGKIEYDRTEVYSWCDGSGVYET